MGKRDQQEELLKTLGDFTSKENWDKFFTIRGSDDSFEWYADWPQLRAPLFSHLCPNSNTQTPPPDAAGSSASVQILVPGCGNSKLSEYLYDAGFRCITNIDFSKVAISDMLRRNVRSRPDMRWRVMDMTCMQFDDGTFDIVLDKGGLDALMEPELGSKLGNQYLSEVKRVLKSGGKFICLTLAETHVLGLLFPKFRYGWKMSLHAIPQKPSNKPNLHTFMVIAEKGKSTLLDQISSTINHSSLDCYGNQVDGLYEALESENRIRMEYSNGCDILYSLEDLQLGAKGDLAELTPGRRVQLTLGQQGVSRFCYRTVLLDAQQQSGPFSYHCGVFLVPRARANEWLYSSEEGQWLVVESSKAARLIMVLLDSSHATTSMDDIQTDLSPLVKQLAPGRDDSGAQIPFMAASDGIKQRKVVCQVTSPLTGPIIVDDVVYEKVDDDFIRLLPSKDMIFRRLTFQRAEGLVQSEALLTKEGSQRVLGETEQKKTRSSSKSKKRGNQRRNDSQQSLIEDSSDFLKVDHNYLASSYHTGIISGFMLISSYLESASSTGRMVRKVKAVVIGLGAGLLPMFLHACLPILSIEVVELDPVVFDLAKDYFSFREDKHLKVCITDGIQFVRRVANSEAADGNVDAPCKTDPSSSSSSSNGSCTTSDAEGNGTNRVDILIIDVDSSDSSSGLTCPAADFVEEYFLSAVKNSLSEHGLFIINLVSRSPAIRDEVVSRIKMVFNNLFHLQLEEDVNEVLFALNTKACITEDCFQEASCRLEKLLKSKHPETTQSIINVSKKIKCLK
ncbi:eEF1A lysine and N-terminal methyltransferase isoform X1 [Camellia sinensis]|uniref:eEF1A lysine and N-terminal methyltransferase isoform X1 n=1 Tax=Camellia sinensis TaxID=4442 RepID=UPI001036C53A|nr:eEF1A lysine and N-terminal methyltransferase isoform X1 [Camellia sinensis]